MTDTPSPAHERIVYKTIGDLELHLDLFRPAGPDAPAGTGIIFFHGGGWVKGTPEQFHPHCAYLASRGMVAASARYRLLKDNAEHAAQVVADAASAVRWMRSHANEYGFAPDRLVAGGGSAGGRSALCVTLMDGIDEPGEDTAISSTPEALVLFNPAVGEKRTDGRDMPPEPWMNTDFAPTNHIRPDAPPMIVFHGTADTTVPYAMVEEFSTRMKEHGNRCELVPFEGKTHAFFNYGKDDNVPYTETVRRMDRFLVDTGFLKGEARI